MEKRSETYRITLVMTVSLPPHPVTGHRHIVQAPVYNYVRTYQGYHPDRDDYTGDARKGLLELLQVCRERPLTDVDITLSALKELDQKEMPVCIHKSIKLQSDELDRIDDYLKIFDSVLQARDYSSI